MLAGRRVVVGVCGSIAAYKMAEVVRALSAQGAEVRVVMTPSATRFVGAATFAALSGNPVLTDVFDEPERVSHVELGRWGDVFLVGAATASTLSRLAAGEASDALSATYLMCTCPVVVAPAMHTEMWEHASVRRNVERLIADGARMAGPATGALASGDYGPGRLADPSEIVAAVASALGPRDLEGVRMLITTGPTREPVDKVRFWSNRSSGRMGFAIAAAARDRGADVTVVAGPVSIPEPPGLAIVRVETAEQMLEECMRRFEDADVVVKAAAVSDWRPAAFHDGKMKKADGPPPVELVPAPDIAAELGRRKTGQVVVLFAAETENAEVAARDKLERKNADLVVANVVGRPGTGFESETNQASLVSTEGVESLGVVTKAELAQRILDAVAKRLHGGAVAPDG